MRLDQSTSDAATLTLARPLATRTDNVSYHVEENLVLDQLERTRGRGTPLPLSPLLTPARVVQVPSWGYLW